MHILQYNLFLLLSIHSFYVQKYILPCYQIIIIIERSQKSLRSLPLCNGRFSPEIKVTVLRGLIFRVRHCQVVYRQRLNLSLAFISFPHFERGRIPCCGHHQIICTRIHFRQNLWNYVWKTFIVVSYTSIETFFYKYWPFLIRYRLDLVHDGFFFKINLTDLLWY